MEILGYSRKSSRDQAAQILDTVKYKGESQAAFMANNPEYDVDISSGASSGSYDHPSYDEIMEEEWKDGMMDDIWQQQYHDAMQDQYEDDWSNQPY